MVKLLADEISFKVAIVLSSSPIDAHLDGTYLSRNFATLGPLTRQPPCVRVQNEEAVYKVGHLMVKVLAREG